MNNTNNRNHSSRNTNHSNYSSRNNHSSSSRNNHSNHSSSSRNSYNNHSSHSNSSSRNANSNRSNHNNHNNNTNRFNHNNHTNHTNHNNNVKRGDFVKVIKLYCDGPVTFKFRIKKMEGIYDNGYRIYILKTPKEITIYGCHCAHYLSDSNGYYICWDQTIKSFQDANAIMFVWAKNFIKNCLKS